MYVQEARLSFDSIFADYSKFFFEKEKKLGVEYEFLPFVKKTFRQLSFEQIQIFFSKLLPQATKEIRYKINLEDTALSLEPGGQLEICTKDPMREILVLKKILNGRLKDIKKILGEMNCGIVGIGCQPKFSQEEISMILKNIPRYKIMANNMLYSGEQGLSMMKMTCGMQVALDFVSDSELSEMLKVCTFLTPLVNAIFSNSPFFVSTISNFKSYRLNIWHHTDKKRCGLIRSVFENKNAVESFLNNALDIPLYYIVRNKVYYPVSLTFRVFLEEGYVLNGRRVFATIEDWYMHLSTIFTEFRLRPGYLEIRSADTCPVNYLYSFVLFWSKILYDKTLRGKIMDILINYSFDDIQNAYFSVPRKGLEVSYGNLSFSDLLKEIMEEIERISSSEEKEMLSPIKKIQRNKKLLSDHLINRYLGSYCKDINFVFTDNFLNII